MAEFYGTQQGFQDYCTARALTAPAGDVLSALRRASVWIDGQYRSQFMGLRELATPGALSPDVVVADRVTSERVGSLAVTYSDKTFSLADRRPILTIIDDILAPLIGPRRTVLFGTTERA
jgi:hypothetical protein